MKSYSVWAVFLALVVSVCEAHVSFSETGERCTLPNMRISDFRKIWFDALPSGRLEWEYRNACLRALRAQGELSSREPNVVVYTREGRFEYSGEDSYEEYQTLVIRGDLKAEFSLTPLPTVSELASFVPRDEVDTPRMQDLLKKLIVSRGCEEIKYTSRRDFAKLLGDFSDERINHLNKLYFGAWKYCPITIDDLKLHLDEEFIDTSLEAYIERLVAIRASALLGTHDADLLRLAFDNFSSKRVGNLRNLLLNFWLELTPTMDELNHSLPEASIARLRDVFEAFRVKVFLVHKLLTHRALDSHSEILMARKLATIANYTLDELVRKYLSSTRTTTTTTTTAAAIEELRAEMNAEAERKRAMTTTMVLF